MDILAELSTGQLVAIEIQLKKVGCYLERARYYEAGLVREQLKSGETYDNLPPIIAIHLLDYMIYPDLEDSIHEYELINRNLFLRSLSETDMKRKKLLEQAAVLSGENIYLVEMRKEISDNNSEEFKNWMCFMTDPYKYSTTISI